MYSYINITIIPLIAYGTSTKNPSLFKTYYLFNGPYNSFSRDWYTTLGFYYVITFIIMNIIPFGYIYFQFYCYQPFHLIYVNRGNLLYYNIVILYMINII